MKVFERIAHWTKVRIRWARIVAKQVVRFVTHDMWYLNAKDLSRWKARLLEDLKSVFLMLKVFADQKIGYQVTALAYHEDVDYPVATKRVLSESYFLPPTREAKSGHIVFAVSELKGAKEVRFAVRPLECFGHKGPEIYSELYKVS